MSRGAARCGLLAARRMGGVYLVEFMLVLFAALAVIVPLAEFLRLSLVDQALARATHQAALAVQSSPGTCQAAIEGAFNGDLLAAWLLDANDDGSVDVVVAADRAVADGPLGTEEVLVSLDWDDPADTAGVCWDSAAGCTDTGCAAFNSDHRWLRVRARAAPGSASGLWSWSAGFERQHRSWASF